MTPTLKRNSSTAASTPIAAATASKPSRAPAGHKHVPGEEQREVDDHPHHRGGDAGERRREAKVPVCRFDQRPAEQHEAERRQKVSRSPRRRRWRREKQRIAAEDGVGPAADEADEGDDHDQRARRRFAEGKAIDHLARGEPVVLLTAPWKT